MSEIELDEVRSALIREAFATVPFARLLGLELGAIRPGEANLHLEVRDELKQNQGVIHGGAVASLIDTAAAFAVVTKLERGERVTTTDLTIHYCDRSPRAASRPLLASSVAGAGSSYSRSRLQMAGDLLLPQSRVIKSSKKPKRADRQSFYGQSSPQNAKIHVLAPPDAFSHQLPRTSIMHSLFDALLTQHAVNLPRLLCSLDYCQLHRYFEDVVLETI